MEKKKIPWGGLVMMALFLLIGGCCGVLIARLEGHYTMAGKNALPAILLLFVGMYVLMGIHIVVHEAGHLVFGLLTGYGFSSFRIGSVMLLKENGRLRLCRHKLAGTGGQCLMTPPDMVDGKLPYVLYNLGGCIANLAGSLLCAVVVLCSGKGTLTESLAWMGIIIGVVFALVNGIPLDNGQAPNDGKNALSLGESSGALRGFWVQMKVVEQISKGIPLRAMPEEWFSYREEDLDNAMSATVAVLSCNRLMDAERYAQADAQMEALLAADSGIVGLHRSLMTCDRITCLLLFGRTEEAKALKSDQLQKFMKAMNTNISILRTEYVFALLAEKDKAAAEKHRAGFEKRAKTHPYPCELESERALMALALEKQIFDLRIAAAPPLRFVLYNIQ